MRYDPVRAHVYQSGLRADYAARKGDDDATSVTPDASSGGTLVPYATV